MSNETNNTENKPEELITHPFEKELTEVINRHCMENESDTPDYILAQYMFTCLSAYQNAVNARDKWFQVDMWTDNKRSKDFKDYD